MKYLIALLMIFSAGNAFAKSLETRCNARNCFKYGWTTTEPGTDYLLKCRCTKGDCVNVGWKSVDNRNSSYSVKCKPGGCFTEGWTSVQNDDGEILVDSVSCRDGDCLANGWSIVSSYDQGGEVTCKRGDCSRFGGVSFWRGKVSETKCYGHSCYKYGWSAEIED